jgi:hypothetical protein
MSLRVVTISFQPPFYQREGVAHPEMPFGRVRLSTQGLSALSITMKVYYLKSTAHAPVMNFSIYGWKFLITSKLPECKQLLSRLAHDRTAKAISLLMPVPRNDLCRLAGNTHQKIKVLAMPRYSFHLTSQVARIQAENLEKRSGSGEPGFGLLPEGARWFPHLQSD